MVKDPDAGCKGTCYHLEMRYNHGTFHQTLCTARGPKSSRNSVRRPDLRMDHRSRYDRRNTIAGKQRGRCISALNNISHQKPTVAGAILDFYMEKGTPRSTSIPIYITVKHMLTGQVHAKGTAIFVTVDENGKKTPHHLS